MATNKKAFIAGLGSLIDFAPEKRNLQMPSRLSAEQRVRKSWARVGRSFQTAVKDFENEPKK